MDTVGLRTELAVTAADVPDREGARRRRRGIAGRHPRLARVWGDGAYTGDRGRWGVERSFAWFGRNRRLSKDYEYFAMYSEPWVSLASIHLMLRRLAPADQPNAA